MSAYDVTVDGKPKGLVYKQGKDWCWWIKTRGIETFRQRADVTPFIARVHRVELGAVKLTARRDL